MPKNEKDVEAEQVAKETKKAKVAEAKREKEIKKERDELEAKKKKKAFGDYADRLKAVEELQATTDTPGWQKFYARLQARIKKHGEQVLDVTVTREIIEHQEGVKILRGLIAEVRQPVDALNGFVNATPLFAPAEVARANFNEALGTVELTR